MPHADNVQWDMDNGMSHCAPWSAQPPRNDSYYYSSSSETRDQAPEQHYYSHAYYAPYTSHYYGHPHWVSASSRNPGTSEYYPQRYPPPAAFHPPPSPPTLNPRHPPSVVYVQSENPKRDEVVYEVGDADVLCGRGAPTVWHPGNQYFRSIVDKYQHQYLAAKRINKPDIAMHVVDLVTKRGGRFLKRTKVVGTGPHGHFGWVNVGEQRAYEKTCQALRENAPEIRRQMVAKELAAISTCTTVRDDDDVTELIRNRTRRKSE